MRPWLVSASGLWLVLASAAPSPPCSVQLKDGQHRDRVAYQFFDCTQGAITLGRAAANQRGHWADSTRAGGGGRGRGGEGHLGRAAPARRAAAPAAQV